MEQVETHISTLRFLDDLVLKRKKPVMFGFVDLSTPQKRELLCHREIELNRRLAPDVYLGVLDELDADGRALDHIVVMRRMPPDRRLATLVARGEGADCVREVARTITAFHSAAPTSAQIASAGRPEQVLDNWVRNVREMRPHVPSILDPQTFAAVGELASRYVEGRERLFNARIKAGRVRDGHGDLQAEDIFCLDDGPRILDCIEFDDRLRWGDVLADVAFLAMDLERLGAPDLADSFLAWYAEFSGDSFPATLADHYVAYRAQVRSKVACLRSEQGDAEAPAQAGKLLDLALSHLERGRVRLILVGGLPGTGKSTLAAGIADRTGWTVLRSDEIRKDLAGIAHDEHPSAGFREGMYSREATARTYQVMIDRARSLLETGSSVICDASWTRREHRAQALITARDTYSDIVELRCELEPGLAAARIADRTADVSDADASVADSMRAATDPWETAAVIDTSSDPSDALDQAMRYLGRS